MIFKQWTKTLFLCFAWYLTSSLNNVVGKHILNSYAHPLTLTLIQLSSITLYSIPVLIQLRKPLRSRLDGRLYYRIVLPLAVGKFLASVSSHVSLWKVPVSYAHTVKATMPLFTCVLSWLIFRQTHSRQTLLSLVPIITGVSIASLTELNFNLVGLVSALLSTLAFSLQNIFSKQVLKDSALHQFELLFLLAKLSLMFFIPVWLIFDFNVPDNFDTVFFLLLDGLLSFLQNIFAFTFLNLVSPLTYSVANASKRIFIIALSIIVFKNDVTFLNVLGIFLSTFGVFLYNKSKLDSKKKPLLPINNNYI